MSRIGYEREGRCVVITLEGDTDLNLGMVGQELYDRLIDYRDDPELWCAVVTGAGRRAFSAGGNIKERAQKDREGKPVSGDFWASHPLTLISGVDFWKPIVAAVNGHCIGAGMMLAMACDIRIAAETATFGIPEVKLGFPPGGGALYRLPRQIAMGPAMEIILAGDRISAQQAREWGLVNRVVAPEALMDDAMGLAKKIAANPPLAVRAAKELMVRGLEMTFADHLRLQPTMTQICLKTEDAREGSQAFSERRPGQFKGR
jgi:E-phenylitaconyl-CoA hydratase